MHGMSELHKRFTSYVNQLPDLIVEQLNEDSIEKEKVTDILRYVYNNRYQEFILNHLSDDDDLPNGINYRKILKDLMPEGTDDDEILLTFLARGLETADGALEKLLTDEKISMQYHVRNDQARIANLYDKQYNDAQIKILLA